MTTFLENMALGLQTAFTLDNILYCFFGVFLGTFVGVLPGIGSLAAVSMLLPVTFYLEPATALVMLAGVYYGTEYGGSTASILLNLPGTTSSAVICLDGYPMTQQGRAGIALFITTIASFVGANMGIITLIVLAPFLAQLALEFGPTEYFAIMLLGLIAAGTVSQGSPSKGLLMVLLGLLIGCIGTDINSGARRYTYGIPELADGVNLVAIAMGLFGVSELIASILGKPKDGVRPRITLRSMMPSKDDMKASGKPMLRGGVIGIILGVLPGTGQTLASFMSYALEKKVAKDPSRFGKGAIEGVASPECSNNAAAQSAFIPTLTMGIPGTATMALMLGALMIHGIAPGPTLMTNHPDIFWGLVASFWIGNVLLVILNIPLIGLWVRMISIPYKYLYPAIICLICIGVYSISYSVFDIWLVLIFGAAGYAMRLLDFEPAPLLIGFVLGPMMEENLRRSLLLSRGDFMTFLERPISAGLIALSVAIVLYFLWSTFRSRSSRRIENV